MANRQTHLDIAISAGLVLALFAAKGDTLSALLAEAAGVVGSSALGGLLPDAIEPGTSSWHRKSFHSVAALAGTSSLTVNPPEGLTAWRDAMRQRARALRAQREQLPVGHPQRTDLWLAEMACRFVAGATTGLPAGYASHLLKDAESPRGLPPI